MLICVVSFALHSPISLNIHNLCQDIDLTSPAYFIHGGKWHKVLEQEMDVSVIISNRIEFDYGWDILEGALIYKIQKQHAKSDAFVQDESKSIQLLVVWHVEHTQRPCVHALLVEHEEFNWNEDKLRQLHQKCWHPLNAWIEPIGINWLLRDTTVLETTVKATNGGYRWDIFISKGEKDDVERPLWIDAKR
jgi:hypothetical protein